ncbi:MAG TPA: DJ-1/PfpI family protein [Polyangiaceae bacterium]|nr:DJ-1/PfpI family protein [Polyangiaceae bacterium]
MQTRARTVALVLFDEVELLDVAAPLSVLSQAGRHWNWRPFKVYTVADRPGPLSTRSQLSVVAEHDLAACPEPEIVIVPGGYGARKALGSAKVLDFLTAAQASATTFAALGNGLLLLAKSGLLAGARIPAREDLGTELSALEPTLTLETVGPSSADGLLESGKIIAGSGSGASLELALRIVARALGPKLANGTAQGLGIPWLAPETSVAVIGDKDTG